MRPARPYPLASFALAGCLACLACRSRARETSVSPIPSSEAIADARREDGTTVPRGLLERFPLRLHTTWVDRSEVSGRTSIENVEERWLTVDASTWDVVMIESAPPDGGPSSLATRFSLRTEGIVAIGTRFEKTYDPYDAPQLWLPFDAHVGQSWTETHSPPAQPLERACHIDDNPKCPGGIAVGCVKTFSTGEITVQTHLFCEGVGWTGYSVVTTDGRTIVERRSGDDVRDLPP
jgi:hypothetical protein